jgi:hypothetical protein
MAIQEDAGVCDRIAGVGLTSRAALPTDGYGAAL